ncbi:MAG: hypothetical protein ACYCZB_14980 [Acidiphilium sp.]
MIVSKKLATPWNHLNLGHSTPSETASEALILVILARRPHPEQGFRTCISILRLFRGLTVDRGEAVSLRAVEVGVLSCDSVTSILRYRLDRPSPPPAADGEPLLHANIRGSGYFH